MFQVRGDRGDREMPSHTHKEQRNTVTLCSPLVGFESSLYYYVTRSHRLHLVHHKWTDVIEKGATGPLDSLLRDLTRWWGSPEWGPRMGTAIHCAHTHTQIYLWSLILYILYIENIYIYTIHRQ